MKAAVNKDGHHFCTHVSRVVVDPAPQPQDKAAMKGADADRDTVFSEPAPLNKPR